MKLYKILLILTGQEVCFSTRACNCPGCLIASLLLSSILQLVLINPLHDNVQGYYFYDSSPQGQLPKQQYGFGEPSTGDRTPVKKNYVIMRVIEHWIILPTKVCEISLGRYSHLG